MAGHPSVKKRQKELQRKERQAEKASRRDERRTATVKDPNAPEVDEFPLDAEGRPLWGDAEEMERNKIAAGGLPTLDPPIAPPSRAAPPEGSPAAPRPAPAPAPEKS
jgi:hypothetical protein